jgi:hypothetical protein
MAEPQGTAVAPAIAREGAIQKMQEAEFLVDFIEKSDAMRSTFVDTWREILDNYMVVPFNDRRPFPLNTGTAFHFQHTFGQRRERSRLKDPETHQIIEALAAQALLLLFNGRDYIQATPVGSDDPEKARLISRLLMGVLEQPGQYRTHYQLFKNAFTFGTSVVEIGWETRSRQQLTKVPVMDESGRIVTGEAFKPLETLYRDAPMIREVDLFDFYPDPSGTRIHVDMQGVAKRFRITKQQARQLVKAGVYLKDGVEKAIRVANNRTRGKTPNTEEIKFSGLPDDTVDSFGILTGFEYWGNYPRRTSDGIHNRVITLLEGEIVRSRINPYVDGRIPFKEVVVNPVGGRFYGLSPAEVIRFLQDATDQMLMVFSDAANMAVHGSLLVGAGFGGDPERLQERRVNDIIRCSNPDMVKPFPVDLGALTFAGQELARRKMTMRESTGATNPLQAIPTSDRQTATEVSELVRLASQKVETMVSLIERDDYPWIGRTVHSRLRQFGSANGFITTLAGEALSVPFDAINVDADVRFVGTRQIASKFQRSAAMREFMTILADPRIVFMFPELVARHGRDNLDIPDAEQIVAQAQQRAQQLLAAENQKGGDGGGDGESQPQDSTFGTVAGETERDGARVA